MRRKIGGRLGSYGITAWMWRRVQSCGGPVLAMLVAISVTSCNTAHAPEAPPAPPGPRGTGAQSPAFSITATEPFDAAGIPAYRGDHPDIYADIDRQQAQHREHLRRWLRQPSISAENVGIQRMAEMLRGDLRRIGFKEAELVPTSGHPGVWGYNINGIWSGYTGPGTKTILPHVATAKVDSRLVPNQTPDDALRLIRQHLDAQGFTDIEIRRLGGYPPAQTSVEAPLVQAAIAAYNKHGLTPSVAPRIFGSAPYHVFTERLRLPMISGGIGHGSGAHAPNEYMVIEPRPDSGIADLAQVEKFYVDLLYALAEADSPGGDVLADR